MEARGDAKSIFHQILRRRAQALGPALFHRRVAQHLIERRNVLHGCLPHNHHSTPYLHALNWPCTSQNDGTPPRPSVGALWLGALCFHYEMKTRTSNAFRLALNVLEAASYDDVPVPEAPRSPAGAALHG